MAGFGGSIKLGGESAYRKALQNITNDLSKMTNTLTQQATAFAYSDKNTKNASNNAEELTNTLKSQESALSKAKNAYATFQVELTKQQQSHSALTREYKNALSALDRIEKESGQTSDAYRKQAQVVDKLEQELAQSNAEMNASKDAMKNLKSEISNSQKTIDVTKKALNDLGKEANDTGNKAKKGGEGFTVMKGVLADLGGRAVASAVNGLKQLGGAIVNVGKQSLNSYAKYEQLVGGVETLFKDSAGIVQEYAKNAYKTSGLSANEYMETMTSFSASLIQSLGGDTKKASEIGNRAIIDMSDNANKMGTDMYMIQNAYQGFAKQNYTINLMSA